MFERIRSKFNKGTLLVIISAIATIVSFASYLNTLSNFGLEKDIVRANSVGTVVKCVEKETGLFSKVTEHQIYVSVPYEYKGQNREMYKCYSVSEDVWNKYGVGDTFNAFDEKYFDCSLYTVGGFNIG